MENYVLRLTDETTVDFKAINDDDAKKIADSIALGNGEDVVSIYNIDSRKFL